MSSENNGRVNVVLIKKIMIFADLFALLVAAVMISSWYAKPPALKTMAEPEEFSFAKENRRVYAGDSISTELYNAEKGIVVLTSEDESIAEVRSDGTVKGISAGSTTISAVITYPDISATDTAVMNVEVVRKEIPSDSDLPYWYDEEIFLLNIDNPAGENYVPELVDVRKSVPSAHKETKLTPECEEALAALYEDYLKQDLGSLRLISTYRSYKKQDELLKKAIKKRMSEYGMTEEQARENALKTRNLPGHSEHQSGLAIDFSTDYTTQNSFHKSKQGKWLTANAHRYGFILRYPADKVELTKINYEPWHFRFIEAEHSLDHAKYIYEHGLCLEEYIGLQEQARLAAEENARNNPLE